MPMEEKFIYTDKERELSEQILESLKKTLGETFYENDLPKLREHLSKVVSDNSIQRNVFGLNPILCSLQTAAIAVKDIGLNRDSVISILLYQSVQAGILHLMRLASCMVMVLRRLSMGLFVFRHFIRKRQLSRVKTSEIFCYLLQKTCVLS